MKKRIMKLLTAIAFVFAAVFVGGVPANAAAGPDCWPGGCSGYYTSSDSHGRGGWDAEPSVTYDTPSQIWWYSDHVVWQGVVKDVYADGKAARALALVCLNGSSSCTQVIYTADQGAGSWRTFKFTKYGTVTDNSYVKIQVCNGLSSDGLFLANCGSMHGPFHQY